MPVKSTSRDPVIRIWNIAILALAVALITLFTVELYAQSGPTAATGVVVTDGRRLNARGGPGTTFEIVGKIEPDTTVEILQSSDDGAWFYVQAESIDDPAWVAAEYVATEPTAAGSAGESTTASPAASPAGTPDATATPRATPASVTQLNQDRIPAASIASATESLTESGEIRATATVSDASGSEVTAPDATNTVEADTESAATGNELAGNDEPDATVSLLPTVTPTPAPTESETLSATVPETEAEAAPLSAADSETDALSDTGTSTRLAARVAPLNLGALLGRGDDDDTANTTAASATASLTGTSGLTGTIAVSESDIDTDTGSNTDVAPDAQAQAGVLAAPVTALEPTATPVPTATPAPTPSVPTAFTQPPAMNVRGGPGTNYPVVDSVPAGTGLAILASNPAGDWFQVNLNDSTESGWVYAPLTEPQGPLDTIAQLSAEELPAPPPTPTPEPAPVAAAASAPAVDAPAPSGGVPFGYGVQAHMLGGGGDRSMAAVNDMGFNWIKQQVQWKLFEPSPGARNFGELQGIVNAAGGRGISVLFSVVDAPEWAREPGFDGSVGGPPADPQTYADFVGAMAGAFCGSALQAIEVWNEQNLHYEWGNKPLSAAEYMNLLRPAYAAIKGACPSMYVISGALTPAGSNPPFAADDFQYLEQMYQNGLANYADGIGAHPSGYNVPPSVTWQGGCEAIQTHGNSFNGACDSPHHSWSFRSTMEGYRNIMVTYGDANKKIWPTEFGWAAGGAFDPRYAYANDNSFDEQSAWTVEAFQMMRNWGWVGPAFLWNLNFRVVADGTEKAQWGIVGNDWQPLPVYNALKAMPK